MPRFDHPALLPADAHNERLGDLVHPGDWVNPPPTGRYNLVVLGGGTAGLVTAMGAAGLGAKVALIERDLLGGDCLNTGCVPSKALLRAAHAIVDVRDAPRFGVRLPGPASVDFAAVMERLRGLRAGIAVHDGAARFRDAGIDVFLGEGRFVARDRIEVGGQSLRFARAVVATGARAFVPPIPGLAEAGFLTNETVFSLTERPRRLGVVGGGPVGCELAQAFARFGGEVHLIELAERVLPREEADASTLVAESLRRDGVRLHLGRKLTTVQGAGGPGPAATTLMVSGTDGDERIEVDAILVAIGRAPNLEGLDLAVAGVKSGLKGVEVDDFLRTANPRIYACGDVAQRHQFTHMADFGARLVVRNALFPGTQRVSALTAPWATFTDPEVAHVGLTVAEAEERGVVLRTFTQPFTGVDRAILDGDTEGYVRIHIAGNSDRILGATIVGRHAGDLISEISVAMAGGVGLGALASVIHPYPTRAEAMRKLGDAYNRTRLTKPVAAAMKRWLALRR